MNRQLVILTIAFGVLFIVGIVWFVISANTRSRSEPPPGPAALFDRDQDGLTDAEEEDLGTNPIEKDSDFDALNDAQEVQVHKTNPLNSDTDGDTFLDGVEVLGGYNPLGPGRAQ